MPKGMKHTMVHRIAAPRWFAGGGAKPNGSGCARPAERAAYVRGVGAGIAVGRVVGGGSDACGSRGALFVGPGGAVATGGTGGTADSGSGCPGSCGSGDVGGSSCGNHADQVSCVGSG
ncbi:hypothetical protein GCM10009817_16450 [Terrabacter lapilli]|uniref:Uncharacterized protein n=1 Tax=Terrabacter lapilli TaxID=436231 RepID=A0ABN2RXV2_9MICO